MTDVVARTYAVSDLVTPLGTLKTRQLRCQWSAKDVGAGSCDVPVSTPGGQIPGGAIVAVFLGGAVNPDLAFVIDADPLVQEGPKATPVIRLAGAGLRRILDYGQVWPPDCPLPGDEIVFGWQHPAYDDIGWGAVQVHGTVGDEPWTPPRPTGFPVKEASFITDDTADGTPRTVRYRRTYSFAAAQQIGFAVSADDELPELHLNGVRIDQVEFRGPFQWKTYRYIVLDVCAGDQFTVAAKTVNLSRDANTAADNPTWFLMAGVKPAADGIAQAANELVSVTLPGATTGTWQMFVNGTPSAPIGHDAAETAVRDIVAAAADDPVTVTKTGISSWDIEFDGPRHANTPVLTSVANIDADVPPQLIVQREGASGLVYEDANGARIWTDTSWVAHTGDDDPGMPIGQIVLICLQQAQGRGVTDLDHVVPTFTATHDTAGNPWPAVLLRMPVQDVTVGMVVERLEAMGAIFDMEIRDGGLRLDGWVAGARGTDLSASIVLDRDDIRLEQLGRRFDTIRNVIRSVTDDGFDDQPDAPSIATYGRREATVADAAFASASEAGPYASTDLRALAQPQLESTFTVAPSAARPLLGGYGKADVITCPSRASDAEVMRVVGITLALVNGGNDELSVTAVS